MKSFIFIICLSCIFFLPGKMSSNNHKEEVVLTNGSMLTLLPCYLSNANQVMWEFKPAPGDQKSEICKMDNNNKKCTSMRFPNIQLADLDGFENGNYSLQFIAKQTDAGIYYCKRNAQDVNGKEIKIVSFKVSATPENAIRQGDLVTLMVETSDDSYFRNRAWKVSNNPVKAGGIEILWTQNNSLINKNSRFQFDYSSLNISKFCSKDEGCYVYTVKLSNGKSAFYSISLQISDQSSTATTSAEAKSSDQNSGATASGDEDNSDQSSTATTSAEAKTSGQNSGTTAPGEGDIADSFNNPKSGIIIGSVLTSLVVFLLTLTLIIWFIKKHCQSKEGPYVNVSPQRKGNESNAADVDSTYMGLKLEEQSVYSQL